MVSRISWRWASSNGMDEVIRSASQPGSSTFIAATQRIFGQLRLILTTFSNRASTARIIASVGRFLSLVSGITSATARR